MSEYQYYEFLALDRRLSEREMHKLRSVSSRARITPTTFVNEYQWGNFKGSPDAWMAKYFDAFLYFANWGTHLLKLRLPSRLLGLKAARQYCRGDGFSACENGEFLVLTYESELGDGEEQEIEEPGGLSGIVPVRAELARGDLRALYLGWLELAQSDCLGEDDREPPVPDGLGELSAALANLADFLRIDQDLLAIAAQASAPLAEAGPNLCDLRNWVTGLPAKEKDDLLSGFVTEEQPALAAELRQRFRRETRSGVARADQMRPRRTVGELILAADAVRAAGERKVAARHAEAEAERHREAQAERTKYLNGLSRRGEAIWLEIEHLIATTQPKGYERAVQLLADLKEIASRKPGGEFARRVEAARAAHAQKPALLRRLAKAGL